MPKTSLHVNFESPSLRSMARLNPKLLDDVRERLGINDLTPQAMNSRIGAESATGRRGPSLTLESANVGLVGSASLSTRRRSGVVPETAYISSETPLSNVHLEAIILKIIRPSLLVRNGTFVLPLDPVPEVKKILNKLKRAKIDTVIARTARVELGNVPNVPYVGTGWIVEKKSPTKAILVTNRHVAEEFASNDGRGSYFFNTLPNYQDYQVNVDFLEEHGVSRTRQARVGKVVFIAGSNSADIALLEVEDEILRDLDPIPFSTTALKEGTPIGVVGYPAYDSRSDPEDVAAYFGDIFDVKRFAFGDVNSIATDRPEFTHDATTLGGNSGSVVFNRETGKAVGLHFAGDYRVANYAVPVSEIKSALKGLTSTSVIPSQASITEAAGDGRNKPQHFKGRDGYNPLFLGKAQKVEPPRPGKQWQKDIAAVKDADTGKDTDVLKYRHFSVWMCKSRKLPLMTAVNINGVLAKRLGRVDKWYIDGRLGDEFQVDNSAYVKNPLDRGHMVRREDPVWGETVEIAAEANLDTFHYTNAAPQHEDLNQRDWVRLEDYVLGNARTRGLQVSAFTGPIFGDKDPDYRGLVKLPKAFWKIAAVVNDETGDLSCTGYILAQGDLIKGLTGEFVYGAFKTYQVEVAQIGELARLDVGHLSKHDPFAKRRKAESLAGTRGSFRSINGTSDLVL
ncbi:DNA/RNA non-specific endonuclease [Mesorhizobium sp. M0478]|uniref:DNA/RNA non-specific endonuclease n=1 Tax=Mesorhizobium sp. M0478 TaxID=2956947 RepID=UPI00333B4430